MIVTKQVTATHEENTPTVQKLSEERSGHDMSGSVDDGMIRVKEGGTRDTIPLRQRRDQGIVTDKLHQESESQDELLLH